MQLILLHKIILLRLLGCFLMLISLHSSAKETSLNPYYFDAAESYFDAGGEWQEFSGDVVAITHSVVLSADHIRVNHKLKEVYAEGHILVLSQGVVIAGNSFTMKGDDLKFKVDGSVVEFGDRMKFESRLHKLLGLTRQEVEFEAARKQRLAEIASQKSELSLAFLRLGDSISPDEKERIIYEYALLLRRESLQKEQKNPSSMLKTEEQKERLEKRRKYWQQLRNLNRKGRLSKKSYFTVKSDEVERISLDQYMARRGVMTPCLCSDQETPAWSIYADRIQAEDGAYIDFEHPVLMVRNVPILYLPYWKMPFKHARQSGFLLPEFSYTSDNGTTFSQPFFVDVSDHEDFTLNTKHIEKRGLGLGFEWRKKRSRFSGWKLSVDGIHDSQRAEVMSSRTWLVEHYSRGLQMASEYSQQIADSGTGSTLDVLRTPGQVERGESHIHQNTVADPSWWINQGLSHCLQASNVETCIQNEISRNLSVNGSPWRGGLNWQGMNFLKERISLVSAGKMSSDHRYDIELELPSFDLLTTNLPPSTFSSVKTALHYDGADHYIGLVSKLGDNQISTIPYSGYQIPIEFRWKSRYFSLLSDNSPWPLYLNTSFEARKIDRYKDPVIDRNMSINLAQLELNQGQWFRFKSNLRMPLLSKSIFQADAFTLWEARWFNPSSYDALFYERSSGIVNREFKNIPVDASTMRTLVSGIHLNLPMHGRWQGAAKDRRVGKYSNPTEVIEHWMNWDITFAYRPFVDRRGNYGEQSEFYQLFPEDGGEQVSDRWQAERYDTKKLTYFPSDARDQRSRVVYLSTSHEWLSHMEGWSYKPPKFVDPNKGRNLKRIGDALARAEAELNALQQQKMREPGKPGWTGFVSEIPALDLSAYDRSSFADFYTATNYDIEIADRKNRIRRGEEAADLNGRPLEPLGIIESKAHIRYHGWVLGATQHWHYYSKRPRELTGGLGFPKFLDSSFSLGYKLWQATDWDSEAKEWKDPSLVRLQSANLRTGLIPHVNLLFNYEKKTWDDLPGLVHRGINFGLEYLSPQRCWGVKFAWNRPLKNEHEYHGAFYLGLVVEFPSGRREFGNLMEKTNIERANARAGETA